VPGRPVRLHRGGAALAVALAAMLVAAVPAAALPARATTGVALAGDTTVEPSILDFTEMSPGTTQVRTATLTTAAPDEAAFVRAVVTGAGPLVDHLTTRVEACPVAWTAQGCSAGEVLLVAGPVSAGVDTALRVPVPATGVAYLRVALTVDATAPANATSTVRHELHLLAPDTVPPVPPGPAQPVPPVGGGPLATTGAEVAALLAAALALAALGLTLRTWGRGRRGAGWVP
jgi:hypothetical protein